MTIVSKSSIRFTLVSAYASIFFLLVAGLFSACGRMPWPPSSPATTAAPSALPPAPLKYLLLHDFDQHKISNNLGRACGSWNAEPEDTRSYASAQIDVASRHGDTGAGLRLEYHLNPERASQNGFWMKLGKLDMSDYDHLEFWVRGDSAAGFASLFKIELKRRKSDTSREMDKASFVVQGITKEWRKISIPLNMMTGITDWKGIDEFVIVFHTRHADCQAGAYSIDEIALVKTGGRGPGIYDHVAIPKKKAWEAAQGGETSAIQAIRRRLVAWPSFGLSDRRSFPNDDREFVLRIARDTWKGISSLADREHGLPYDTVRFGTRGSVRFDECRLGDYTNITNIGLYLMSLAAARDLKFIADTEAVGLARTTLDSLDKMETWKGFYYNYYDCTSLERSSNFVSFVDSAWLTAGLIVLRNAFPVLKLRCDLIINRQNYELFYDPVEQHMNHGWYVHMNARAEYNYGALYTEPRAGSVIAIGLGAVPEEHWFALLRTFPASNDWQALVPQNRVVKNIRGHEVIGGYYSWGGLQYVPSWGGSLFEALMPTMIIDEMKFAPKSLGRNDLIHATIHRKYALEELKYPIWGMSPSSVPTEDNYSEYGVRILGTKGYKPGAVTPHVSGLAVNFTPREAIANFREMIKRYDCYGEFGFYDAIDPVTGQVSYKYLALDQEMLFLGLANYLGDHCVQRYFEADPVAQKGLAVIGNEDFLK